MPAPSRETHSSLNLGRILEDSAYSVLEIAGNDEGRPVRRISKPDSAEGRLADQKMPSFGHETVSAQVKSRQERQHAFQDLRLEARSTHPQLTSSVLVQNLCS